MGLLVPRSRQERPRVCGFLSLWGFFSAPPSHRRSLPSILHATGIRVLSTTDSALVYMGLPGTVHWAAPQGRICPLDHSLSHSALISSLLDCTPRLQAPQTLEGRPGFSPRLGGEQTNQPSLPLGLQVKGSRITGEIPSAVSPNSQWVN